MKEITYERSVTTLKGYSTSIRAENLTEAIKTDAI